MAMHFIARAACHGQRPSSLNAFKNYERARLLGRLVKERGLIRFLVAPDGYGKTSLALSYAETIMGWRRTFWISGQSPCFLRDLDARAIAEECFAAEPEPALVVIDGLPLLDEGRSLSLVEQMESLRHAGCEVLVCCNPVCDISGCFSENVVRLGSADLLLDDDELDLLRPIDQRKALPVSEMPAAQRIAGLQWAEGDDAAASFAERVLSEELPSSELLAAATLLVLQVGSLEVVASMVPMDGQGWQGLAARYPHLGLGAELDAFEAVDLPIQVIATALKGHLAGLGAVSVQGSQAALVAAWAEALLQAGMVSRACQAMLNMSSRNECVSWLAGHSQEVIGACCLFDAYLVASRRRGLKGKRKLAMTAIEALCRKCFGDDEAARSFAHQCLRDEAASDGLRFVMAVLCQRLPDSGEDVEAQEALALLESRHALTGEEPEDAGTALGLLWIARQRSTEELLALWERFHAQGASHVVTMLGAAWYFEALVPADDDLALRPRFPRAMEEAVRSRLREAKGIQLDYFTATAGLAMEEAHRRGIAYNGTALEASALFALRQVEVALLAQRNLFGQEEQAVLARRMEWLRTHPSSYPAALSEAGEGARRVPLLSLRLFGSFQVTLGDAPIDQARFRRQSSRVLLALLAVNQGREMSRDVLAAALWPASDGETARKNFYTAWAQLRKVLMLSDGTCPYLIRHQYGCCLDSQYVQTDVDRLAEICRELLFAAPDPARWAGLYSEIDRDFSGELMPSESDNELLLSARAEYRGRLIDALVAGTGHIVNAGHPEWGIWFARAALSHDPTREDAWIALMQAQIANSQRTAAMGSFLECRRILGERLGIDPSFEAFDLYNGLLDGNATLALR